MSYLKKIPTRIASPFKSQSQLEEAMAAGQAELSDLQEKLYASRNWSVLIVLQGMDTAGKDGLIEHVMKGINPQGCHVHSFKKPTHAELDHDFLWRTQLRLPERGKIGIFNRSYYEDVIVPQVHPEVLLDAPLPKKLKSKKLIEERCEDIINVEKYLNRQGTKIIKIFLHLSKSEQKARLEKRLENPDKHWKFEAADITERGFWHDYQKAYSKVLKDTDHKAAPWTIIPADDKPIARYLALQLLLKNLKALDLEFPEPTEEKIQQIRKYQKALR